MIIPRPNNVIISPIDDPDMSDSGLIYIPEQAKERCDQGIVKYVGSQCHLCQVGDWVLFSGYAGTLMFLEGEGRLITMHERMILAVVGPQEWAATNVSGVYYKNKYGDYFPATYESLTERLSDTAFQFLNGRIRPSKNPKESKVLHRPRQDEVDMDTNWTEDPKLIENDHLRKGYTGPLKEE
jgi:co-chaperonin GroES (HSP10)